MKILITGSSGQVGWELVRQLGPLGQIAAPARAQLDLAQPNRVASALRDIAPGLIVNAAAFTAVDRAESEPQCCHAVNAESVRVLADYAGERGIQLVHYSTDYVFDGRKGTAYREDDPVAPINTYGRSKLEGEQAIIDSGCRYLILRTSWVYAMRGSNFVLTMLRLAKERPLLRVVSDQIGAPTWAHDIAAATRTAVQRPQPLQGLYHLTAQGATTWCDFARRILQMAGLKTPVEAITTAEYPTPAARPAYSVLDSSRFAQITGFTVGQWDQRLQACFESGRGTGQ